MTQAAGASSVKNAQAAPCDERLTALCGKQRVSRSVGHLALASLPRV
ncbi:MAG: hypothetical protein ACT4P6_01970 [Gemmatimonadaceae bacterium]